MGKGRVPKNEGGSIRAQEQGGWPETHHINHEQEPVLQNCIPIISHGVPDVSREYVRVRKNEKMNNPVYFIGLVGGIMLNAANCS